VLLLLHVQYTMFYSVTTIAALRGLTLFALSLRARAAAPARAPVAAPGVLAGG
jgi:hypothetical protein